MPWLETDVRDQRIQFVVAARKPGACMRTVCDAFGIRPKTGYKWLKREAAAGSVAALMDGSRRPHRSPRRTSLAVTAQIKALRATHGWGGDKLAVLLRPAGVAIAPRTIDRIIQREGWTRRDAAPAPAVQRFERAAPNELWQMDAKGHYPLDAGGCCHPLSILDDHSRYAVGLVGLPALETDGVQRALVACFEQYGVPTAMLMDHGVPWWCAANGAGLTRLSVLLLQQGIRLHHGRVRHPQTQGKVERFHRTLAERLRWAGVPTSLAAFTDALAWFRDEYNQVRPHEALAMQPPAARFTASSRAYTAHPPRWEYAAGSDVRRVDAGGMVTIRQRRFFVSEALTGHEVACTALRTRVLVTYRDVYVRELHLDTGRSVSLLAPAP
jgi:transposase InsO family protein